MACITCLSVKMGSKRQVVGFDEMLMFKNEMQWLAQPPKIVWFKHSCKELIEEGAVFTVLLWYYDQRMSQTFIKASGSCVSR